MKCSNYVGETIDMAVSMGVEGILFVSHIGKFVKVAAGIMNPHSRCADARAEVLAANAMRAGISAETALDILNTVTTDEALVLIQREGKLKETMKEVTDRISYYLHHRAYDRMKMGAVIFSIRLSRRDRKSRGADEADKRRTAVTVQPSAVTKKIRYQKIKEKETDER